MSKKRTLLQASLNDYGFDTIERQRIRGHCSDYNWLLNKFAYPAKIKRGIKKKSRARKKPRIVNQVESHKRMKVIALRYGKYEEFFENQKPVHIKFSFSEIGRMLTLKGATVTRICKTYEQRGFIPLFKRQVPVPYKLSPEQRAEICQKSLLTEQAGLPMRERVLAVERKYQVKISRTLLFNIYCEHGIRRKEPAFKFTLGKRTEAGLQILIRVYVKDLIYYMRTNKMIIYIDQTSTHLWEKLGKFYMPVDDPIDLRFKSSRGSSVTVMGAISSKWTEGEFKIC